MAKSRLQSGNRVKCREKSVLTGGLLRVLGAQDGVRQLVSNPEYGIGIHSITEDGLEMGRGVMQAEGGRY